MLGWASPYLAQLIADDSPLPLTTDEASWVASLLNLGRFLGAIAGGVGVEFIGTRRTLIVVGFPLLLAFICIIVANSVIWLYIARILSGLSMGMTFCSFPIFLGEISKPSIRGSMVSLGISGFAFGTAIGNTMGAYMSMDLFSYVSLVPNLVSIILLFWIPDSPHYLVRLGRIEEAEISVARYNPSANPKSEVEILEDLSRESRSLTFKDRLREVNKPQNRRALMISIVLYFFMQTSGINTVIYYLEIIVTKAKVTIIHPATLVAVIGFIGIGAGWVSIYVADKFRRKVLMVFSSIGTAVSMIALGVHFALLENDFDPEALQWLPIASIISFIIFVCNGLVSVPNIIVSELFAPNIKSVATSFVSLWIAVFAFAASKSYQPLIDLIKEAWVFWIHAIILMVSAVFSAVFIPETKGKSLKEIQDALNRK